MPSGMQYLFSMVVGMCCLMAGQGHAASGTDYTINGNTVVLQDDNVQPSAASDNIVHITDGTKIDPNVVFGGNQINAVTERNKVIMYGGTARYIYGGNSTNMSSIDNTVNIFGGTVLANIIGGVSQAGQANDNNVSMGGGSVEASVYGGTSTNGKTIGNHVLLYGNAVVQNDVYGGLSVNQSADGNTVTINGGNVLNSIYGGHSSSGSALSNVVYLNGGNVGQEVYGAYSAGTGAANGNRVAVSGSVSVANNLYGGYSFIGQADGNTVTIQGGRLSSVIGGQGGDTAGSNRVLVGQGELLGSVYGGWSTGSANGNEVSILGTATYVGGNVVGGYSTNTSSNNNIVSISGSAALGGNVYGGYSQHGTATNNTVNISGNPQFSDGIYGGGSANPVSDKRSGNTLNIYSMGLVARNIAGFQHLRFYLPPNTSSGGTVLTLNDGLQKTDLSTPLGQGPTTVGVGLMPGGLLHPGDTVTLIKNAAGITTDPHLPNNASSAQGMALNYNFDIISATDSLVAKVRSVEVNPQTKSLSEGRASSLAFANQAAEMIAGQGMDAARVAADNSEPNAIAAFGGISAGFSRYNTGSHVDVNGASLITGFCKNYTGTYGRMMLGAFFEGGRGNYNSYNSFNNAASVDGWGDLSYYGGGILARFDWASGMYVEGSLRAGNSHVSYRTDDLVSTAGERASYDAWTPYYSAHAGLGNILRISESISLDSSIKYLWTRQQGFEATIASESFTFQDADSHRLRAGLRLSFLANEVSTLHAGAYYEHEFDGKIRATVYDWDMPSPSLQGDTGIGEIGLTLRPSRESPFSVDMRLHGYVGKREGLSGSVQAKFEF